MSSSFLVCCIESTSAVPGGCGSIARHVWFSYGSPSPDPAAATMLLPGLVPWAISRESSSYYLANVWVRLGSEFSASSSLDHLGFSRAWQNPTQAKGAEIWFD
ncbi:hypothetical protein VNO77_04260 [Canavalia gladiata]|uniref:Uncharacterized protein n=1 Tax=Canavalia gladiata TaxID=3824 RepID=A0AAN9MY96_CANGL